MYTCGTFYNQILNFTGPKINILRGHLFFKDYLFWEPVVLKTIHIVFEPVNGNHLQNENLYKFGEMLVIH